MFAPAILTSFPGSGPYSTSALPAPISSGIIGLTEVTNLIDTRWARAAIGAASSSSSFSSGSLSCDLSRFLGGSGAGAGFANSDASLFGGLLGLGNDFDLAGLMKVLTASAGSLAGAIGELGLVVSLQSMISGIARSFSSVAGTAYGLLQRFLDGGMKDFSLINLATKFMDAASSAVELFVGGAKALFTGSIAGANKLIGGVISGTTGMLAELANKAELPLSELQHALLGRVDPHLAGALEAMGLTALIPPKMSVSELTALFPSNGMAGVTAQVKSMAQAIAALGMETLAAVGKQVRQALGITAPTDMQVMTGAPGTTPGTVTGARSQGLGIIDGINPFSGGTSSLMQASATIIRSATVGRGSSSKELSVLNSLLSLLSGLAMPSGGGSLLTSGVNALGVLGTAGRAGMVSALADILAVGCSVVSALASAFSSVAAGNGDRRSLEQLLESLLCRMSGYSRLDQDADRSSRENDYLRQRLLALWNLVSSGNFAAICALSSRGSC